MKKFIIISIIIIALTNVLIAATINVPADYSTIQAGINAAVNGDVVLVQPGTYTENVNFNGKNVTVASLYHTTGNGNYIETTIVDGNNSGSVVSFTNNENSNAVLSGLKIQNGSSLYGGGININSSSPTISNCIIENNTSTGEGNVYGGGGIAINSNANPFISSCIIKGNYAADLGGGIKIRDYSDPNVINCLIINNSVGDATYNRGGGISITRYSDPTIINCSISNNTALVDCGGGVSMSGNNGAVSPIFKNTIIWGNSVDNIAIGPSVTFNITYSDVEDGTGESWFGTGCIDSDPLFVNRTNNNYYLLSGSPCLSSATSTGAPSKDLDGRSRPLGSGIDMGCYEQYDDGTLPIVLTSFTADYTVNNANSFVSINWSTASEVDINGFNIYRSENDEISYAKKVNDELIPGTNTTQTQEYRYYDEDILLQNIQAGDEFWYWLEIVELNGLSNVHSEPAHLIIPDEYEPEIPPELPITYGLYQNVPNPFNPININTNICFNLQENSNVRIDIYNAKGQLIRNLYNGYAEFGEQSNPKVVSWNGRNENEMIQESGIYFYKMSVDGVDKEVKKMLLIR